MRALVGRSAHSQPRSFLVVSILVLGLIEPYNSGLVPSNSGQVRTIILLLPCALAGLAFLGSRHGKRYALSRPVYWLVLAGLWLVATSPYGLRPPLDFLLSTGLLFFVLFGAIEGRNWTLFRSDLLLSLSIALGWSLLVVLVDPSQATVRGRWSGVFGEPNKLGFACALAILLGLDCWVRGHRGGLLLVLPAVVMLAQSESRTSVVAAVLAVAVWASPLIPRLGLVAFAALLPILLLIASSSSITSRVAEAVSRSGEIGEVTSVTGRTDIWKDGLTAWSARPIAGYGAGSTSQVYANIRNPLENSYFPVQTAHNFWLQLALNGGIVAVALVAAGVGGTTVRLLAMDRAHPRRDRLALLLALLVHGITEDIVREPKTTVIILAALAASSSLTGESWTPALGERDPTAVQPSGGGRTPRSIGSGFRGQDSVEVRHGRRRPEGAPWSTSGWSNGSG